MAKEKQPIQCSTCFYGKEHENVVMGDSFTMCRRFPDHVNRTHTHWCGEYLDEKTGKDLVQREN